MHATYNIQSVLAAHITYITCIAYIWPPQWILLAAGSLDPRVGCFFDAATSSILRFAAERWKLLSFCSQSHNQHGRVRCHIRKY